MNISVLILTFNEELNVGNAIASCKSISNDIVILDSFSSDDTCQIAENAEVRVYKNKFKGYASQRNFALETIDYKNNWVLMLDADETLSESIQNEILQLSEDNSNTMYSCRRKDYLLSGWLKRSSGYPTWFPRLFKKGECWVEREINEVYKTNGDTGSLNGHLHHFPFNKGLSEWFIKHVKYSKLEAKLLVEGGDGFVFKNLFSSDTFKRRAAQKSLVYKLPFRPIVVFCIFYFIKKGFLDGKPGLYYCLMKFCYELMISCQVFEIKSKKIFNSELKSENS